MAGRSFVTALALAMAAARLAAQSQAVAPTTPASERLTFEVASIKRNVSGAPNSSIQVQPSRQIVRDGW